MNRLYMQCIAYIYLPQRLLHSFSKKYHFVSVGVRGKKKRLQIMGSSIFILLEHFWHLFKNRRDKIKNIKEIAFSPACGPCCKGIFDKVNVHSINLSNIPWISSSSNNNDNNNSSSKSNNPVVVIQICNIFQYVRSDCFSGILVEFGI